MRCARLLASLLALVLFAVPVHAATNSRGLGLRWNQCFADGGAQNENFACNSNSGTETLVGSFVLPADKQDVSGLEIVMDLASASSVYPTWWQFFQAGACRLASFRMNLTINPAAVSCLDWANAQAAGGIGSYNIGNRGPNTARVKLAIAVPPLALQSLTGLQEYFAFNLVIDHGKTVGTGSCTGCNVPVCIVFNSINVTTPILPNNIKLSGPSNLTDSDFALWQGGGGVIVGGQVGCPAATPTAKRTWGAVKALYH